MTRAFFEELPCALTAPEKLQKGSLLVERLAEKAEVQAEKKEATSGFKQRIDAIDKIAGKLAQEIRTGKEYREVECYERLDFADNKVEVLRADTGEVWRTRPMRPDERQEPLPIPGAQPTAVPPKKRKRAPVDLTAAAAAPDNDNGGDEDDEFKREMQ